MIAAGIQSFHYHAIIDDYGCCPIAVAIGEAETGKKRSFDISLDAKKSVSASIAQMPSCLRETTGKPDYYSTTFVRQAWHRPQASRYLAAILRLLRYDLCACHTSLFVDD